MLTYISFSSRTANSQEGAQTQITTNYMTTKGPLDEQKKASGQRILRNDKLYIVLAKWNLVFPVRESTCKTADDKDKVLLTLYMCTLNGAKICQAKLLYAEK